MNVMTKDKIGLPFSTEPDDVASFLNKDSKKDGSAESSPQDKSVDQGISTFEPHQPSVTPDGHPKLNEFGNNETQNLLNFWCGSSIFDRGQEQSSQPLLPKQVVKEEFEQSSSVAQAPSPASLLAALFSQNEPYDIPQDVKPNVDDLNRVVTAEFDRTKYSQMLEKEDSDEELDVEMKEEETEQETVEDEDFSDVEAHLDLKNNVHKAKNPRTLKKHLRTHSGEKPYQCDICPSRFSRRHTLLIHVRSHTGEKPFACEVCQKTFSQNSILKMHMRIHTGEKPYSCETCGSSFSQSSSLKIHVRSHTGEKPFSCDVCKKVFSQKRILKGHMRTHTEEKFVHCEKCDKRFRDFAVWKQHMLTHAGERQYECKECDQKFVLEKLLIIHRRSHQP